MLTELRLAARRLLRDRWTTITAVVTVALGAGVAISVFAFGFGLMLRPLPYDPENRLWLLDVRAPASQVEDWRARLSSFERLTTYAAERMVIGGIGDTRQVRGAYVDSLFFDTLHGRPIAGRVLSRHDLDAAVVSVRLARTTSVRPETLLGRQVTAGGSVLTIVGVLPESFAFPASNIEIWVPSRNARPVPLGRLADARQFRFAGWLRAGVPGATAAEEISSVRRALQPDARPRDPETPVVDRAAAAVTGNIRSTVLVFAGAAGMLWIVTCANLATILVGRTIARRRELTVCHALGAGLWRRTVTLCSESLLITVGGMLLGLLLASIVIEGTLAWAHELIPRPGEIRIDSESVLFAAASCGVLTLVATLLALPALHRNTGNLHGPQAGVTLKDRRLRGVLLISQVAFVVILVSGGALLVRTLASLLRTDLGLDHRHTLVSELVLTPTTAFKAEERVPVLDELLVRTRMIPGVRYAGAGSSLPPEHEQIEISVSLTGSRGEEMHTFSTAVVTAGYLEAIGSRLLQGRYFDPSDIGNAPTVVLSESAARAVMKGPTVAGQELPFPLPGVADQRRPMVIGVVADVRYSGLEVQPDAAIYVPWHLAPMGQGYLAIRTTGEDTSRIIAAIRTHLRELDPSVPHMPMRSLDEVVERSVGIRRVAGFLGAMLALLAFAVALVGLAGNVLRSVEERRRELAIRTALGASPARVVGLVASSVVLASAIGLAFGTAGALGTSRILSALVEGVRPYDALTLGGVAIFVMMASLLASYLPARLATRIDPAEVLKGD